MSRGRGSVRPLPEPDGPAAVLLLVPVMKMIHWSEGLIRILRSLGPGRRGILSICLAIGLAASACDPGVKVDGVVRGASGIPVAEAAVSIRCPKDLPHAKVVRTDDAGTFAVPEFIGCLSNECAVVVRKATGEIAEYSVDEHCRGRRPGCGRGLCNDIHVEATC